MLEAECGGLSYRESHLGGSFRKAAQQVELGWLEVRFGGGGCVGGGSCGGNADNASELTSEPTVLLPRLANVHATMERLVLLSPGFDNTKTQIVARPSPTALSMVFETANRGQRPSS